MTSESPPLNQLDVHGDSETRSRLRMTVRDLEQVIDEPEARGGTNQGVAPTEAALAGLLGCINVVARRFAEQKEFEVRRLEIDATAHFDPRGPRLIAPVDVPFPLIEMTVVIDTSASATDAAALRVDIPAYCPIWQLFARSGTRFDVDWQITPGA
jgi:putative redox protein